jgi:glucose-6-phosphate 1-dehydrogenase
MSIDIVLFGGTGDLTWRKLMPALANAFEHGGIPKDLRVLGVAREAIDTNAYRERMAAKLQITSSDSLTPAAIASFVPCIDYLSVNLDDPASFVALKEWVSTRQADAVVMYLATAPHLFAHICEGLARVGLNHERVRVVLEKPLGHDLESATQINDAVRRHFTEQQIFRIDHYLGKQSVQNLLALRFGNSFFEPLWRREWIANVQITIAEELGVEGRGGYYDHSGALRDMVQNHLLQLLCIVAMEPPASDDADAIRDEKLKVLKSLRPYRGDDVNKYVVRGQYHAGAVTGIAVPSYIAEPGVEPQSHTETFVALRAEIDNWRWAGVPFFLRTGKRLGDRRAQIVINFRDVPHPIMPMPAGTHHNRLVIELQPHDAIELHLLGKASNLDRAEVGSLRPAVLDLDFKEAFGAQAIEAYERLLRKVVAGRLDLFVRLDEQLAAWKWVMPILENWQSNDSPLRPYNAGTWGPVAASALLARDGTLWSEER